MIEIDEDRDALSIKGALWLVAAGVAIAAMGMLAIIAAVMVLIKLIF